MPRLEIPRVQISPTRRCECPLALNRRCKLTILGTSTTILVSGFVRGRKPCLSESSRLARISRTSVYRSFLPFTYPL